MPTTHHDPAAAWKDHSAASVKGADSTCGSPPHSRVPDPRADLRLARGFRPLERVTASLKASPRPAAPHLLSPTRALNAPTHRRRSGQRTNPCHADPLTLPGNLAPTLCGQPATVRPSPALCECCAQWQGVILRHCATRSHPPSMSLPSKTDCNTLEECMATNLRLTTTIPWRKVSVTTPPEIIPYYRLNHSIWSLSNNKEVSRWVLPGQRPVNHLTSQRGSNVCIKTPTKESPECLTN
jgi:hypothetical protein